MYHIILIIFIVAFVDSLLIIVISNYNKLIKYRNVVNANYADISKELAYRVELCRQYIPIITPYVEKKKIDDLNMLLIQFNLKVSIIDIANIYYTLNAHLTLIDQELKSKGFNAPEWDKAFTDSFSRLEALRVLYDDNVLKLNNIVDMPPTNIIAKMFGFVKWPYFRNS